MQFLTGLFAVQFGMPNRPVPRIARGALVFLRAGAPSAEHRLAELVGESTARIKLPAGRPPSKRCVSSQLHCLPALPDLLEVGGQTASRSLRLCSRRICYGRAIALPRFYQYIKKD
jgi:hypothetical protein